MKTVLCIGRWQPLHKGHIKLLTDVIREGNFLVVGIRDTRAGDPRENPYTVKQRRRMIKNALGKYKDRYAIAVIPDYWCDLEVRIGRKVGYKVQRYDVDVEDISGTKTREVLRRKGKL